VVNHFWDESHALSGRQQRFDIERRLAAASRRLGSPVFVLVVHRLHHETAAAIGARIFGERVLNDSDGSDPVLLVISIADHAAAIETGKGNAGIVPEIDARRITRSLSSDLSHGTLIQALRDAIAAIVDSAEATADRRRPLPPDEESPAERPLEPSARPVDAGLAEDGGVEKVSARSPGETGTPEPEDKPHARSRVPLAAIIAGLLLLALAIRRRRKLAATREDRRVPPPRPPGPRRK
jgi:hypothetical protein